MQMHRPRFCFCKNNKRTIGASAGTSATPSRGRRGRARWCRRGQSTQCRSSFPTRASRRAAEARPRAAAARPRAASARPHETQQLHESQLGNQDWPVLTAGAASWRARAAGCNGGARAGERSRSGAVGPTASCPAAAVALGACCSAGARAAEPTPPPAAPPAAPLPAAETCSRCRI